MGQSPWRRSRRRGGAGGGPTLPQKPTRRALAARATAAAIARMLVTFRNSQVPMPIRSLPDGHGANSNSRSVSS
ncbi:protein of unknown function [Methylorubrum extorquens]|uniref:Uncharacterized protein n=1 Tax=Methylorubrum extorquens TaxID=408 RepID=A0A2N9AVE7_METEX|nr:protein of unknown function [Methylorubrum extorquens]